MNTQHLEVFAGEDRTMTLYARDADNAPASLTGKTISWRVGRGPRNIETSWPIFTKTGSTISASAGTFSVTVTPSDTQYLSGDYQHQAVTTDGSGNVAVVTVGQLRVRPTIEAGT